MGEWLRSAVRPIILITGWVTILGILVWSADKFLTPEIFLTVLSFITGSVSTMLGFYFKERSDRKHIEDKQ